MLQSRRCSIRTVIEIVSLALSCFPSQRQQSVQSKSRPRYVSIGYFTTKSYRSELPNTAVAVRLCAFIVTISLSMIVGCATPHAILNFTAPATAMAGSPFSVTVTVTLEGKRDTIINSTIHFTSSDPAALLPSDYEFISADAGSHTWNNGFTLMTPGNQQLSAIVYDAIGINGTANVKVSP